MIKITMPQAGQSMEEGTIVRWLKAEGEKVTKGEIIFEIETDKSTIEVEAGQSGTLRKILVAAGQTLPVHAPIALMGEPKENIKAAQAEAEAELASIRAAAPAAAAIGETRPAPAVPAKAVPATPAQLITGAVKPAEAPVEAKKNEPVKPAVSSTPVNVTPILMPKAGQSVEEATIVKWRVQPGATIKKGDVIFEVETDKSVVEVESAEEGRLARITVGEGAMTPVLQPVAYIAENDADVDIWLAQNGASVPAAQPVAQQPIAAGPAELPQGVTPILMPKAGQSVEEATIVKWRVQPGAVIKKGDVIFEVETDKSVVEVESAEEGRLSRITVGEGAMTPVLQPVAYLGDDDAVVEQYLKALAAGGPAASAPAVTAASAAPEFAMAAAPAMASAPAPVASPAAYTNGGRVKASPAARKVAAERGLDLHGVGAGSGPGGRILSSDLASVQPASKAGKAAPAALPKLTPTTGPVGQPVRQPMSGMRKAIARNLLLSKTTIPHWYIQRIINADPMMNFYKAQKPATGCSVNDVLTLACSRVIREMPQYRSQVKGDDVIVFPGASIGVAVAVPDGLVVPVVLDVDRLTLGELAVQTKRVAESARGGKIENMGKGVFTISNLGMYGVDQFTAIINPPEAAILAVSAVKEGVIVKDGMMRPGRTLSLTLSADHRLIDGAVAAQFMARLVEILEAPEVLA